MTTIIVLSIVAILVLVGAVQRKKIAIVIKGKVNDVVEKQMTSITTAKQMIRDAKARGVELVNQAAELKALEDSQSTILKNLKEQSEEAFNQAKRAKDDNNEDLGKAKLSMHLEIKSQILLCEENILTAKTQHTILETKIAKIKNMINTYEIQIQGLKARQDTNTVLNKIKTDTVNGNTIKDIVDGCETKVKSEEVKLAYKTDLAEETDVYSEDVETEFDKL